MPKAAPFRTRLVFSWRFRPLLLRIYWAFIYCTKKFLQKSLKYIYFITCEYRKEFIRIFCDSGRQDPSNLKTFIGQDQKHKAAVLAASSPLNMPSFFKLIQNSSQCPTIIGKFLRYIRGSVNNSTMN